jgi:hypothetical protein
MEYTLEKLIVKLKADVIGKWHPERRKGNDGSAGNTLEDLLGVAENNLKLPDWGAIELKTKKKESASLVTLLHREPLPNGSVPKLLECLGWKHKDAGGKYPSNEKSFRSTTRCGSYSDRGFSIDLCNDKVTFVFDPREVNLSARDRTKIFPTYGDWLNNVETRIPHHSNVLPVYWEKNYIISEIKNKLDNTLYCLVKTKTDPTTGGKLFWFESATLFTGFNETNFDILFKEKALCVDFDARTNHNHGTKFRVDVRSLAKLFDNAVDVF